MKYVPSLKIRDSVPKWPKQVPKSYEYKLRSMIKKKVDNLLDREIPSLSPLFPNIDLTNFGKMFKDMDGSQAITEFGKASINKTITNNLHKSDKNYKNP